MASMGMHRSICSRMKKVDDTEIRAITAEAADAGFLVGKDAEVEQNRHLRQAQQDQVERPA